MFFTYPNYTYFQPIVDDVDIESEIEKFVKSVKGQQFWFKVYSEKNFLKINAESIRPKN